MDYVMTYLNLVYVMTYLNLDFVMTFKFLCFFVLESYSHRVREVSASPLEIPLGFALASSGTSPPGHSLKRPELIG